MRAWIDKILAAESSLTLACGRPRSGKTLAAANAMFAWGEAGRRVIAVDPARELRYETGTEHVQYITRPLASWLYDGRPPADTPSDCLVIVDEASQWTDLNPRYMQAIRTLCRMRGVWGIHVVLTTQRPTLLTWVIGTMDHLLIYRTTGAPDLRMWFTEYGLRPQDLRSLEPLHCKWLEF